MVKETLRAGQKPTKAQIKEIRLAEKKPITYTDDAPRLTNKELAEFKQIMPKTGKSPLEDIPRIKLDITTQEIVEILNESRAEI